ncbi:MAG: hypothetical protein ACJ763_01810, partial [Bdellovibrionia bacterium]
MTDDSEKSKKFEFNAADIPGLDLTPEQQPETTFAPLAEQDPVPGTGVLKLGYPIEVQRGIEAQKGRPASARFGAV